MKKNNSLVTLFLVLATLILFGVTIYISSLLSSSSSPTQIQKTKAAAITYSRTVDLNFPSGAPDEVAPTVTVSVPITPTTPPDPTRAATPLPTVSVIKAPTIVPTIFTPSPSPTSQPLLAYKSTSISPTLIPIANTGGMDEPTKVPTINPTLIPTKTPTPTVLKTQPTGVQQLPQTGWVQTSSILFIVAVSTIFFSLLF